MTKRNETKELKFYPTEQTWRLLDRFADVGLYGNTAPAVASILLNKQLVELVKDGTLEKLESEVKG